MAFTIYLISLGNSAGKVSIEASARLTTTSDEIIIRTNGLENHISPKPIF